MLLTFFLKTGLANLAVPVWVELKGLIGTLRLRIQLKPDPPFLGQMTMTFMGIPRLEIDAAPLRAVSIMDVPVISAFVRRGIDAAMATYTAPSSLALDVGEMISG